MANTPYRLHQGLMNRVHLNQAQGMLFVFPFSEQWGFWMKNTLIFLDIIWLDQHKKIIYILHQVPPCGQTIICPSYQPPHHARYVLELAANQAKTQALHIGQQLYFKY